MNRRDFFKKSIGASFAATAALTFGTSPRILPNVKKSAQDTIYDLVAVKGGEPEVMFDKAIEAIGGIERFVKPNQKVVVKPNIGWNTPPERAANTNPKLVKRIIEHCFNAGAKDVYVFDNTCDDWKQCYENSGIEKAAKDAGAKVVPGNNKSYYQSITIKNAKILKDTTMHELILDSDVFINVPILKDHMATNVSLAMKNLMGIVWDRGFWHRNDLHQCIADYTMYRKPDLNIVDAYNVMKRNGPRGVSVDDCIKYKSQIISTDIVAADTASAKILGREPEKIGHIKIAYQMGLGNMKLEDLSISRMIL